MKAGAINATTGLAHSAVNTVGNIGSAVGASIKKAALYNDENRESLSNSIYLSIIDIYNKHMKFVNNYYVGYFEEGFQPDEGMRLFESAQDSPENSEKYLVKAVKKFPDEIILSYIFNNYPDERKNVYKIGELLEYDFGKYVEESFAKSYTEEVKNNSEMTEEVKSDIFKTMEEYGINTSATLNQINQDVLMRIMGNYKYLSEEDANKQVLKEFVDYNVPDDLKGQIVHYYLVWDLAKKYNVNYKDDEKKHF